MRPATVHGATFKRYDEFVAHVDMVEAILEVTHTGNRGDGKVFHPRYRAS